jgi:hypothetical protein
MSNNQQTMKLYTEEQVKMMLDKMSLVTERKNLGVSSNFRHRAIEIDNLIKLQTAIELPSDEEIIAKSKQEPDNSDIETAARIGYVAGAKWMRDKIQGGNK